MRRMVGASAYDRLVVAFKSDAAYVVIAVRRFTRYAMPYAVVLGSCFDLLSAEQVRKLAPELKGADFAGAKLVQMILQLDEV